jgi:hypothetical protein
MTNGMSHEMARDVAAGHKSVSDSRVEELLDFATVYSEFDENTPDGTESDLGSPMNSHRREQILLLKELQAHRAKKEKK